MQNVPQLKDCGKFESQDFYLCSFLMVNGCELATSYKKAGSTLFVFNYNEKLQSLIKDYYFNQNLNVNAQAFGSAIRALKSIIYQARSNSNSISTSYSEDLNNGFYNKSTGTK
jgi:hypothetical protein